jgi:hypothetical protein
VAHVPKVPYLAIGSAYGLLAVLFVIYGTIRQVALSRALDAGSFEQLHRAVINVLTGFLVLLSLATIVLLSLHS